MSKKINNDELIKDIKNICTKNYNDFNGLYVYGSRVKESYDLNSDLDIIILFNNIDRKKKLTVYGLLSKIEYKYNIFIDVKILTDKDFKINPFFYNEVKSTGVYYEAT